MQRIDRLIQVGLRIITPNNRVFFKKPEPLGYSSLLTGVHQRHAKQRSRKHRHGITIGPHALCNGAVPRVFIVVGDKHHAVRIFTKPHGIHGKRRSNGIY